MRVQFCIMDALFQQFADYLSNVQFSDNKVVFAFLPYDLVDKDIDIDEVAYEESIVTFRRYLDSILREARKPFVIDERFLITRDTQQPYARLSQYAPLACGRVLRTLTEVVS